MALAIPAKPKKKKKRKYHGNVSCEEEEMKLREQPDDITPKELAELKRQFPGFAQMLANITRGDESQRKEARETISHLNDTFETSLQHFSPQKESSPRNDQPKSTTPKSPSKASPRNDRPKSTIPKSPSVASPRKSPKKPIYQTNGEPLDTSEVTEELCYQELLKLKEKYDHQKNKCNTKNKDFSTSKRGLRKLMPVVEAIKRTIGTQFQPKSKRNVHKFSKADADLIGQEFLDHCEELKGQKIIMKALKSEEDGNCLLNCISRALNGNLSQIHEIRLRASIYFLEFFNEIHAIGSNAGWANTTGTG